MNNYIRFSAVLFVVVAISCGLLALVNKQTSPIIEKNIKDAQDQARMEVVPIAQRFNEVSVLDDNTNESFIYYEAFDAENQLIGYTTLAEQYGYSGVIQIMVGLDLELSIMNIKIISQSETPGLGTKILKPEFLAMFPGQKKTNLLIDREGGEIKNITGATISTKAVTTAIRTSIEKLEKVLNGGENEPSE